MSPYGRTCFCVQKFIISQKRAFLLGHACWFKVGEVPPSLELVKDNTKVSLVFPIWETFCFYFGKPVPHFLANFLFAKWKTCTSKMFPIREKILSTVSQMGRDLAIEQSTKYTNKTCLIEHKFDFERNMVKIWLIFARTSFFMLQGFGDWVRQKVYHQTLPDWI